MKPSILKCPRCGKKDHIVPVRAGLYGEVNYGK
jgi:hypothetical protein